MTAPSMLPVKARAILVAAALLVAGGAVFAQNPPSTSAQNPPAVTLTVEETVARALANQPVIQQAQAAVEAARARVGQAQSAYYPFVSGTASYLRLEPEQAIPFGPSIFQLVPVDNWDFNVGLNQVIFQFGKRGIQVKLAESGVSAAQIGVEQIQMSLVYQTVQGFYTVLFLKGQLLALDAQRQNLEEHLAGIRLRMQTGSATRYDELSTEARVSVLDSQRIDAENQLDKQEIALRQLLGMEGSVNLDLKGDFSSAANPSNNDDKALVDASMTGRAEVRQALEAERAAELNRSLVSRGSWPTISARASLGYKNGILMGSNPDINAMTFDWLAGVQVNVPLFEGFLIARQNEEADKKLLAARENTLAVKKTVTTQVLQALQDVEASRRQVESARVQLAQAQGVVDVVKVQYDLGLLTNLEYLDAQAGLERAQLGMLLMQYHEVLSEYALRQAAGEKIWTATTDGISRQ